MIGRRKRKGNEHTHVPGWKSIRKVFARRMSEKKNEERAASNAKPWGEKVWVSHTFRGGKGALSETVGKDREELRTGYRPGERVTRCNSENNITVPTCIGNTAKKERYKRHLCQ